MKKWSLNCPGVGFSYKKSHTLSDREYGSADMQYKESFLHRSTTDSDLHTFLSRASSVLWPCTKDVMWGGDLQVHRVTQGLCQMLHKSTGYHGDLTVKDKVIPGECCCTCYNSIICSHLNYCISGPIADSMLGHVAKPKPLFDLTFVAGSQKVGFCCVQFVQREKQLEFGKGRPDSVSNDGLLLMITLNRPQIP